MNNRDASRTFQILLNHHDRCTANRRAARERWSATQESHKGDDWLTHYLEYDKEDQGLERASNSAYAHIKSWLREKYGD